MAKELKLWVRNGESLQHLDTIPDYGVALMLRAAEHEAGHTIAAHHLKAGIRGIALAYGSDPLAGLHIQSLCEWTESTIEAQCIVSAAGPAAQALYCGGFTDAEAQGDLANIAEMTGVRSLEPYLTAAKDILRNYPNQIKRIATLLRESFEKDEQCESEELVDGMFGWMLLDEDELMGCLE